MKYLKSLFSFILPLIMVLSSFSIYLLVDKIVDNYKDDISKNYSIIVIANESIMDINKLSSISFQKIEKIDRENIIDDVKEGLSDVSLQMLTNHLPYFYQVYLEEFPTNNELEDIKKTLTKLEMIRDVEVFESEHTNLYSLFILTKQITMVLFIIVLASSFVMLLQQIRLWLFEYSEKITILQLLGASLSYSTKSLVKIILVSILISLFTIFSLMYLIIVNFSLFQPELLTIMPTVQDMYFESILIVILSIAIPSIAFTALIIKHRLNNDV